MKQIEGFDKSKIKGIQSKSDQVIKISKYAYIIVLFLFISCCYIIKIPKIIKVPITIKKIYKEEKSYYLSGITFESNAFVEDKNVFFILNNKKVPIIQKKDSISNIEYYTTNYNLKETDINTIKEIDFVYIIEEENSLLYNLIQQGFFKKKE